MTEDPRAAAANADVIITDTWVSMGFEDSAEARHRALAPYRVTRELLEVEAPGGGDGEAPRQVLGGVPLGQGPCRKGEQVAGEPVGPGAHQVRAAHASTTAVSGRTGPCA